MKTARKHELASDHFWRHDPVGHSFSCVFRQLKLHRLVSFTLDDGHPFANSVVPYDVCNFERDQVATAQLAIDCDVEQSEIAKITRQFKASTDGPDLFRKQWTFLSDEATLVPGSAFRSDGRKLNSRHDLPSIQPSYPYINIALTTYYNLKPYVGFAMDAPPSVSAKAKGGGEPDVTDAAVSMNVRFQEQFQMEGLIAVEFVRC